MVGVGVWVNEKWKKREGRRRQKRECVQVGRGHSTRKARKLRKARKAKPDNDVKPKSGAKEESGVFFQGLPLHCVCKIRPLEMCVLFLRLWHGALAHPHVVQ